MALRQWGTRNNIIQKKNFPSKWKKRQLRSDAYPRRTRQIDFKSSLRQIPVTQVLYERLGLSFGLVDVNFSLGRTGEE